MHQCPIGHFVWIQSSRLPDWRPVECQFGVHHVENKVSFCEGHFPIPIRPPGIYLQ
jgi:hypothetical protein